jgi:hypothetical protein
MTGPKTGGRSRLASLSFATAVGLFPSRGRLLRLVRQGSSAASRSAMCGLDALTLSRCISPAGKAMPRLLPTHAAETANVQEGPYQALTFGLLRIPTVLLSLPLSIRRIRPIEVPCSLPTRMEHDGDPVHEVLVLGIPSLCPIRACSAVIALYGFLDTTLPILAGSSNVSSTTKLVGTVSALTAPPLPCAS